MLFDCNKYEQAVGPAKACQDCLKLFIEDEKNEIFLRKKAEDLYAWIGYSEADIDELFKLRDYDTCIFMLDVLEKYPLDCASDFNLIMRYSDAYNSLVYQKSFINKS